MGMAQLVVTAVLVEGRSKSGVARTCAVSRRWVITLVARFLAEGEPGLELRSRRPRSSPGRTAQMVEDGPAEGGRRNCIGPVGRPRFRRR